MALQVIEHFPVFIVGLSMFLAYTMLLAGYLNRRLPFFMSLAWNSFCLICPVHIGARPHGGTYSILAGWVEAALGHRICCRCYECLPAGHSHIIDHIRLIYSRGNVRHEIEERKHVTFYVLVQLMACGFIRHNRTGDLFNMFIWLEIASLTAYALIAVAGGRALRPAYNYVIMGSIGALLLHLWSMWLIPSPELSISLT